MQASCGMSPDNYSTTSGISRIGLHLPYFNRFRCNHIPNVPCRRAHFLRLHPSAIVGLDMNWET